MNPVRSAIVLLFVALCTTSLAQAAVRASGAWARATMPGQTVAGVYMRLESDVKTRLVGVRSAAAKRAEVHEMSHQGGVMKMRKLDGLDLPAGRAIELQPGGLHIMLLDIRQPLQLGQRVALTLIFESGGKRVELPVEAEVKALLDEGQKTH